MPWLGVPLSAGGCSVLLLIVIKTLSASLVAVWVAHPFGVANSMMSLRKGIVRPIVPLFAIVTTPQDDFHFPLLRSPILVVWHVCFSDKFLIAVNSH